MKKFNYYVTLILTLVTISLINVYISNSVPSSADGRISEKRWDTINVDGDASFPTSQDATYWNRHSFRFDKDVEWAVDFGEYTSMQLKTSWGDAGHVAAGMWWNRGFVGKEKVPISDCDIRIDFDVIIEKFAFEGQDEWLRVALACAVQREDGEVVYTELDLLDSPNTAKHPSGNVILGGDVIYRGGDVVEFKVDEAPLMAWRHHSINLTSYLDRAWKIRDGDRLESVYIVIESENNPAEVELGVDNLWIYRSS